MDSSTLIVIVAVIVIVVLCLALMASGLAVIQSNERGMYFRFGRFVRVLQPGLNMVTPMISEVKRIDVSPTLLSLPIDDAIASDRTRISIKATVHYRVTDPMKAFFETNDYKAVVKESSVTAIRVAVGRLDRHVVWSDLKGLSAEVRQAIADNVERIGIGVDAVELAP